MPNGHTTYPTLAATARRLADRFPRAQYPGTVDELKTVADGVDSMAAELARTRAELEDTDSLAERLRSVIDTMGGRIGELAAYAAQQPCVCSEHELRSDPDAEPCLRCKLLGRRNDEPVDQ